jgi:hypothetical protein
MAYLVSSATLAIMQQGRQRGRHENGFGSLRGSSGRSFEFYSARAICQRLAPVGLALRILRRRSRIDQYAEGKNWKDIRKGYSTYWLE